MKKTLLVILSLLLAAALFAAELKQYKIDKNHSNIGFSVPIMNGLSEVHGKFTDVEVELLNDEGDVTRSKVKAAIKAASIDTGIDARDTHLRTADFFDAERYPEIVFESKNIEKKGKGFIATGNLTMRGVTKEIALPFEITGIEKDEKERTMTVGYAAKMRLNRQDFGINWKHNSVPNFVGDDITIEIHLITRSIKY
ncbi:MAG: YceI family protein [Pyrinomonadaceae bacterium]